MKRSVVAHIAMIAVFTGAALLLADNTDVSDGTQAWATVGVERRSRGDVVNLASPEDHGVGTYTDSSVANQISNFTINPLMVSCGVGTLAHGQWSGPFAMLMYSTDIRAYEVERAAAAIRASGTMRSITKVAGETVEDVEHEFLALAVDGAAHSAGEERARPDRFDVHLRTDFWNVANPMCSPSDTVQGGCRFGGDLLLGDIFVRKPSPDQQTRAVEDRST